MKLQEFSREKKMDAFSALAALGGIALMATASELSAPLLMAGGVCVVVAVAIARVWDFRDHLHEEQKRQEEELHRRVVAH